MFSVVFRNFWQFKTILRKFMAGCTGIFKITLLHTQENLCFDCDGHVQNVTMKLKPKLGCL